MSETEYAHPEVLVSTDWLAAHLHEPNTRIVESNEDVLLYDTGHIPGAVFAHTDDDLSGRKTGRNGRHPLPPREDFAARLAALGADDSTLDFPYIFASGRAGFATAAGTGAGAGAGVASATPV